MFSLQKLLGKEDVFFDLLEASAGEACHCVQALKSFVAQPDNSKTLDEFIASRRKEKSINSQISDALCTSFVTALEREDIEALSTALYKIPKTVEKIAERIMLAPPFVQGLDIGRQLAMLEKSTNTVLTMIKELRKGAKLEPIKRLNENLQAIEGEADKLVLELLKNLYSGKIEGTKVVFLKDLYELLEKVTDRCRDAGNTISHIILKYS